MTEERLVEYDTVCAQLTNTGYCSLLFSIRNNKFIRARMEHDMGTRFYYRVKPGVYLRLSWTYWNKRDPPNVLRISIIYLYLPKWEKLVRGYEAEIHFTDDDVKAGRHPILTNPIVADFLSWRPCYHCGIKPEFSKIYSEGAVKELIEFARSRQIIVVGEEHE